MVSVVFAFYKMLHVKNSMKLTKLEMKQIAFYCRNERNLKNEMREQLSTHKKEFKSKILIYFIIHIFLSLSFVAYSKLLLHCYAW